MSSTLSNKFKYLVMSGEIHFATDSFKIILMASGFIFDKSAHRTYADVSAYELPTGYGYTRNTKVLTGCVLTEDDINNRASFTANTVQWTASGGNIGPTPGAIIFDDTHTTDPIVGYIDFGGDQTQVDGGVATISNIEIRGT